MAIQFTNGKFHGFNDDGTPMVGGLLYTYVSGTTIAQATYTDSKLGTPNTNPVVLNSRGEASVWLGANAYTMTLQRPDGTLVWSQDGVQDPAAAATTLQTSLASATDVAKGSALVGHSFSLNYATATVGNALNSIALQVKDTGNATTNSNAIKTTLALMGAGGTLYLPDAMTLDSTVSIVISNPVRILGNRSKRIQFTSTLGSGYKPIDITATGVVIEDCWFDGSLIANTNNASDTVYYVLSEASDTIIRGCKFTNFPVYRVPCVCTQQDTTGSTDNWYAVEGCTFNNTGGGVLSTCSNTRVVNNTFIESLDTAVAINGMGARITTGAVIDGNVFVTLQKVGPYLIAIEGATNTTVVGNYAKSTYGQCLSFVDVDPGTQTVEYLGTVVGNTWVCETTADTDPRNLVNVGTFYKGGTFKGNTYRGIPGVGTNALQLSISVFDHNVSDTFDTSNTATANGYDVIDYQPAAGGAAGTLTIANCQANVTRAARFVGSTSASAFASGATLVVKQNTLLNNSNITSIILDAPANGAAADPVVQEYASNQVVGTAIPTQINGLSYNTQAITYGRDYITWSNPGSAGRTAVSPASSTGINYYSDSATAAGTGWKHIYCTSSSGGAANFAVLGNGNAQNANNSYGAISDLKLKQDIVDAGSQWSDIKALRLRKYHFKSDPSGPLQLGLVAQEAELVSPGLIEEVDDIRHVDGEVVQTGETTKTVKYSVLYLKALGALQEAMARIEALEAQAQKLGAK